MGLDSVLICKVVKFFWSVFYGRTTHERHYLLDVVAPIQNSITNEPIQALKKFKLLSYNIFMRPFVKTNKSDYKDARLAAFLEHYIMNYDVIALQEMFSLGSNRSKLLIRESEKKGFAYNVTLNGSWRNLKPIDSGLVILSKYPIIERDAIVFKVGIDIDGWANKGALSALIQIPTNSDKATANLKILIITTHLQAEYDSQNPVYLNIQLQQLSELKEFILKKHKQYPNAPIVLCGDFNINARISPDIDSFEVSATYAQLLNLISLGNGQQWRELVSEQLRYHPTTFGDAEIDSITGEMIPKDTVLTHPASLIERSRLDYIFFYPHHKQPLYSKVPASSISLQAEYHHNILTVSDARVEPFYIQGYPFTQLSDHYGVSATFSIVKEEDLILNMEEKRVMAGDIIEEQSSISSPLDQPKEIVQDSNVTIRLDSDTTVLTCSQKHSEEYPILDTERSQ